MILYHISPKMSIITSGRDGGYDYLDFSLLPKKACFFYFRSDR